MPQSSSMKNFSFHGPGNYRIRALGFLDESWSDRLSGMHITASSRGDQGHEPITTLTGQVRDQTALAGVLNTLYELHLSLLSVEYLNGD